jgi:hypothetical protein
MTALNIHHFVLLALNHSSILHLFGLFEQLMHFEQKEFGNAPAKNLKPSSGLLKVFF